MFTREVCGHSVHFCRSPKRVNNLRWETHLLCSSEVGLVISIQRCIKLHHVEHTLSKTLLWFKLCLFQMYIISMSVIKRFSFFFFFNLALNILKTRKISLSSNDLVKIKIEVVARYNIIHVFFWVSLVLLNIFTINYLPSFV